MIHRAAEPLRNECLPSGRAAANDELAFMRFLYRRHRPHLENLCGQWHFSAAVPADRRGDARRIGARQAVGRDSEKVGFRHTTRSNSMMDILMLALAAAFFALAIGYTYACERL